MAIHRAAAKVFAAFLRLYPSRFQSEFGPEITEVFSESVRQAERRGLLPALAVSLREVVDFPINLTAEYWEEYHMQKIQLSQSVLRPVWWGAVGFGCSAVLANLFSTAMYLQLSDSITAFASNYRFWGEFLAYTVLGGLGGLIFALVCRQPAKARLYFMGGSFGFLIGHLLWYAIMVGSSILLFYSNPSDMIFLIGDLIIRWVDLALMLTLSGLFIGWMEKGRHLAGELAGSGALGAAIGGLLGFGFCGLLVLIGPSMVDRITLITSQVFVINSLAGIFGGALFGRAIGRESPSRETPAAS